jgi:hypothetical protein
MKIRYFADTDTLYIVFSQKTPAETRDLDENTLLDLDEDGSNSHYGNWSLANPLIKRTLQLLAKMKTLETH